MTYRIVLAGATRFGLRCLETVLQLPECTVVGVITLPETFPISYRPEGVRNVLHADFAPIASQRSIPVHLMTGKMSDPEVVEQVRMWQPDLVLVVGWYHLVPRSVREIAPAAGLHASLLPDYSGGAPLVWAMINGETRTGITFFMFDDGIDSGPIIAQAEEPIFPADTIATLYARIEDRGIELIREHLPRLARGEAELRTQDETRRRVFPQRSPEDGLVAWSWPARRVYDFVRAQTRPYPGAFTFLAGEKLTIWEARRMPDASPMRDALAGSVPRSDVAGGRLLVGCGDGELLELREVQYRDETLPGCELLKRVAEKLSDDRELRLGK